MTAKSETVGVVAWLVMYRGKPVGYATSDSVELVRLGEGETLVPVVPESALAELRKERDSFAKHCDLLTHKVITCGVAARHPDAGLSKRGSYAGKWDSPQAQDVRDLRDAKDTAEAKLTTFLSGLEALAGEWEEMSTEPGLSKDEIDNILTISMDHTLRDCAKQLRTLASTATNGELK